MSDTSFDFGSALACQRWSQALGMEVPKYMYWSKFIGKGSDSPIVRRTELDKAAGDKITVGLAMKLTGPGASGDDIIEGTSAEEGITFHDDAIYIDQLRKSSRSKGKMSEKRTVYDVRSVTRDRLAVWYAEVMDEFISCYLSGARGIDSSFKYDTSWTGFANNSLETPDSDHIVYGGTATGKTDISSSSTMAASIIRRLTAKLAVLDPAISPLKIKGEDHYILVMHPFQAYSLKSSTSTNDWADIYKNAGQRGDKNPLFAGALGMIDGVILHSHRNVIRFDDYGNSGDLPAARALLFGAQAGIIAFGSAGAGFGSYDWHEEFDDRGNRRVITVGSIFGVKKSRFNDKDFVVAVDTYAADPNP